MIDKLLQNAEWAICHKKIEFADELVYFMDEEVLGEELECMCNCGVGLVQMLVSIKTGKKGYSFTGRK